MAHHRDTKVAAFVTAISNGDHLVCLDIITSLTQAGDTATASELMRRLVQMARTANTTVVQRIGTVPSGATVIGYRADQI